MIENTTKYTFTHWVHLTNLTHSLVIYCYCYGQDLESFHVRFSGLSILIWSSKQGPHKHTCQRVSVSMVTGTHIRDINKFSATLFITNVIQPRCNLSINLLLFTNIAKPLYCLCSNLRCLTHFFQFPLIFYAQMVCSLLNPSDILSGEP